jgi:tRNA A-37 threonylcarbamoyl transferase component Bud32
MGRLADDEDTLCDPVAPTRVGHVGPLSRATRADEVVTRPWSCPSCSALYRAGMVHCPRDGAPLAETTVDPLVGQVFAGRYLIEATLGEGGMGRVYRARHTRLDRRFAIKVLHAELSMHESMVMRFHREATAISKLSHHNVVGVFDFGEQGDGLLYLVMEYVDGRSLRDILRAEGPLASDRILELLGQLCDGLAHAHQHGLVHRDFKPDNVLVETHDDGEHARIVDFGIAADTTAQRITTDGLVLGTPHYMAPEQAVGRAVDHRSDLYALGVVLYEMVTGVQPFAGPIGRVAQLHAMQPVPPMAERAPGVTIDPLLEALARRLMAKHPADRIASAQEVRRIVQLASTRRGMALAAPGVMPRSISELPTQPAARRLVAEPRADRAVPVAVAAPTPACVSAPPRRRRGPPPWLMAAVAVPGAVLIALRIADTGPIGGVVTPALDVSPPVSALAVEAAPAEPAAAGPAEIAMTPATVTRAKPRRQATERGERRAEPDREGDRAPRRVAAAEPDPPSISARYRELGVQLQRLVEARGAPATAGLRARYFAIRITDGLRDPAAAARIGAELADLRRDVDRARR